MTTLLDIASAAAIGASLAADAASVSICIGMCHKKLTAQEIFLPPAAFGIFQFIMPLAGGAIADGVSGFLDKFTPWVSALLIIYIAFNMIKEAKDGGEDRQKYSMAVTLKNVIVLATATSLDALAVGFSVEGTGGSAFLLALLAGIITFALSLCGIFLGKSAGKALGNKLGSSAEYIGGFVLLAIAAKIIFAAYIN